MDEHNLTANIEAVRRFNRFYTQSLGVLNEGLLESPFSLTEARVLYELAQRGIATATEMGAALKLDAGYLSRILHAFEKRKLLSRKSSSRDARQSELKLTAAGRREFQKLDRLSKRQVETMLAGLSGQETQQLLAAMQSIEQLLGDAEKPENASYLLRPVRPGDLGWVVRAHGEYYGGVHGWDETFEALVARVAADFINNFDPQKERCWIAERDGEPVGSVFLVRKSATVAKLRLLIVDPRARGMGIGKRLVDECTRFARQAGYRKITLWTNHILKEARGIYQAAGYRLVRSKTNFAFGKQQIDETWELTLSPP